MFKMCMCNIIIIGGVSSSFKFSFSRVLFVILVACAVQNGFSSAVRLKREIIEDNVVSNYLTGGTFRNVNGQTK